MMQLSLPHTGWFNVDNSRHCSVFVVTVYTCMYCKSTVNLADCVNHWLSHFPIDSFLPIDLAYYLCCSVLGHLIFLDQSTENRKELNRPKFEKFYIFFLNDVNCDQAHLSV